MYYFLFYFIFIIIILYDTPWLCENILSTSKYIRRNLQLAKKKKKILINYNSFPNSRHVVPPKLKFRHCENFNLHYLHVHYFLVFVEFYSYILCGTFVWIENQNKWHFKNINIYTTRNNRIFAFLYDVLSFHFRIRNNNKTPYLSLKKWFYKFSKNII